MRAWAEVAISHRRVNLTFAFLIIVSSLVVVWSHINFSSPRPTLPASNSNYSKAMYSTVAMQPVLNVPEIVPIINSDLSGADTTSRIIPTSIKVEPSKQTIPSVSSPVPPLQNLVKTVVDPSLTVATNAIVNTPLIDVNATSGCVSLLAIEACLK